MEDQASLIGTLFEKTELYTKTSVELYKLKAIGKSAEIISGLAARLTVIVFITLFILILNIGIALWLGDLLGKSYYGFFIVAGFYAFCGIVLYIFRVKWIKSPLKNSIINQALN